MGHSNAEYRRLVLAAFLRCRQTSFVIRRDPGFLDLAFTAYRAMPDVALQACDIVREKTGKLYLMVINPGRGTWMFSSANAADIVPIKASRILRRNSTLFVPARAL